MEQIFNGEFMSVIAIIVTIIGGYIKLERRIVVMEVTQKIMLDKLDKLKDAS